MFYNLYLNFIMSSKSTPLSQLSQNSGNNDSLVNEILAEIGNDESSKQQQNDEDIMREKLYQQQMLEQQMLEQQEMMAQQQEMLQQQQQELANQENVKESQDETKTKEESTSKFSLNGLAFDGKLKAAAIVGAICIALSIPAVSEMISKVLPNKPFIMNNTNVVVDSLRVYWQLFYFILLEIVNLF